MKVALISLDQQWEDKAANLQRCNLLAQKSASLGAKIVIFPEMTLTGFTMNTEKIAENPDASESIANLADIARKNKVIVVAGVVLKSGSKAANTLVAFEIDGVEQARYTKIHPFSLAGENEHFNAGKTLQKMPVFDFLAGFTICYDLRFPELYSALARDCNLIINIANWPKRRIQHWRTLLQARAIENQVFIIGVNRTGVDGNALEYEPSSMVVNPNGEIQQPTISDGEIDIYELNRDDLDSFLRAFTTRQDRKPELYRSLI